MAGPFADADANAVANAGAITGAEFDHETALRSRFDIVDSCRWIDTAEFWTRWVATFSYYGIPWWRRTLAEVHRLGGRDTDRFGDGGGDHFRDWPG